MHKWVKENQIKYKFLPEEIIQNMFSDKAAVIYLSLV